VAARESTLPPVCCRSRREMVWGDAHERWKKKVLGSDNAFSLVGRRRRRRQWWCSGEEFPQPCGGAFSAWWWRMMIGCKILEVTAYAKQLALWGSVGGGEVGAVVRGRSIQRFGMTVWWVGPTWKWEERKSKGKRGRDAGWIPAGLVRSLGPA
jgi:hypothetical protein